MTGKHSNRIGYLDMLRVIASVMIVGVHTAATFIDRLDIPSADFFTACSWDVFMIYGVPLFVMISGALNLRPYSDTANDRSGEFRTCLLRAARFMLIYFIWLMFYNLLNCHTEGYGYSFLSIRRNVVLAAFLGKGIYHLWFLPMLAGLSLVTPLLRPVAADRSLCRYFIILWIVICIIIPTLLRFDFRFHTVLDGIYQCIPFVVVTGYTGYYLLGYYLAHHPDTGSASEKIYSGSQTGTPGDSYPQAYPVKPVWILISGLACICLISWAIASLICCHDSVAWGQLSTKMNDPFVVTDLICATCIFLLVKMIYEKRTLPAHTEPSEHPLHIISSATFGIYIIHPALINIASWFGFTTLFAPQIISLPLVTVAVYIAAFIISFALRHLPIIRKLM